jgi:hypothetical protein
VLLLTTIENIKRVFSGGVRAGIAVKCIEVSMAEPETIHPLYQEAPNHTFSLRQGLQSSVVES